MAYEKGQRILISVTVEEARDRSHIVCRLPNGEWIRVSERGLQGAEVLSGSGPANLFVSPPGVLQGPLPPGYEIVPITRPLSDKQSARGQTVPTGIAGIVTFGPPEPPVESEED